MITRENHEWDDTVGTSPTPWFPHPDLSLEVPPVSDQDFPPQYSGTGRPDRNPLSRRFHELLEEAGDLHDLKQADYGLDSDPFANVRASQAWGMPAWVGAMVRATDKVKRLQTYARKGELRNEAVQDAFLDLAVYALIASVLWEEENDPKYDGFA